MVTFGDDFFVYLIIEFSASRKVLVVILCCCFITVMNQLDIGISISENFIACSYSLASLKEYLLTCGRECI